MPELPKTAHRLHPPEDFFNAFASPKACAVTLVARGAPIDGGSLAFLGNMRRDFEFAAGVDKSASIVTLVCCLLQRSPWRVAS